MPPIPLLLPGSVLYFFVYLAFGSLWPFIPVMWREKGMSDHEVGLLAAIKPTSDLFVGPIICAFLDKHSVQQEALYGLIVLFAFTRSSVLIARGFLALAAVEAASSLSHGPISSLMDAAAVASFGSGGYGIQRSWGAIGYGIAALVSGFVHDYTGTYDGVVMVFAAALLVSSVAARSVPVGGTGKASGGRDGKELPIERPASRDSHQSNVEEIVEYRPASPDEPTDTQLQTQEEVGTGALTRDQEPHEEEHGVVTTLWIMFSTPQHISFFTAVICSGMCRGFIETFLFVWLHELGGSNVVMGSAGLVMSFAEAPFFYLVGPFIRAVGPRNVVILAQIGFLIRFIIYSVLQTPWWVLPVEILHGLTYASLWAATTDYSHGIAPAHLRTTMRATAAGLKGGLGYGLGVVIGGVMYSGLGPRLCFLSFTALPSLSLLLLVGVRQNKSGGSYEEQGPEEDDLEGWESRSGGRANMKGKGNSGEDDYRSVCDNEVGTKE